MVTVKPLLASPMQFFALKGDIHGPFQIIMNKIKDLPQSQLILKWGFFGLLYLPFQSTYKALAHKHSYFKHMVFYFVRIWGLIPLKEEPVCENYWSAVVVKICFRMRSESFGMRSEPLFILDMPDIIYLAEKYIPRFSIQQEVHDVYAPTDRGQ